MKLDLIIYSFSCSFIVIFKRQSCKVKVKVKLSLCFNWAPRHEGVLGEWRYSTTHSLTSALDGGEWSASRPGRFTPREKACAQSSTTPWRRMGEWSYSFSSLDECEGSASPPGRFTSGERDRVTSCIGGWIDPRAGLEAVANKEGYLLLPGIEPR
jgi:hypothetical protein